MSQTPCLQTHLCFKLHDSQFCAEAKLFSGLPPLIPYIPPHLARGLLLTGALHHRYLLRRQTVKLVNKLVNLALQLFDPGLLG